MTQPRITYFEYVEHEVDPILVKRIVQEVKHLEKEVEVETENLILIVTATVFVHISFNDARTIAREIKKQFFTKEQPDGPNAG
jgi:hypothetical protein